MQTSRTFQLTVVGLLASLGALVTPLTARAEEPFPGALQEAAGLACAPSCTICHTTNPGNATSWPGKPFGAAMFGSGVRPGASDADVKAAYDKFAADPMNAAKVALLLENKDPDNGNDLCQITYGCGARIAKDEPRDDWSGLLFVAGAIGFGALLRRTKRR